jgi:ABC-type multidrug transport system fused ATPase/permease subunit
VRHLQEARVSIERVSEMLAPDARRAETLPDPRGEPPRDAVIVLRSVAFAYPGKAPVFDGVDLEIARGERVALFGASGVGKSTLVHLIFGLREPAAGAVWIDGRRAHASEREEGGATLGYAGAEPFLLHATVEENLRYGNPHAQREDIESAAALAAADRFIAALPDGYATVVGGRGLALSDGQRQRLGLARLFLSRSRILVLDEAFSGLDIETEMRVRGNLWREFFDRTLLVVSHRPVDLEAYDRILYLHGGRFVAVTAGELRTLVARGFWAQARERVATFDAAA